MMSYEVMVAAVSGDPVLDESGRVEYGVDTLRKTQLQGKLLAAMLRFEP